MRSKTSLFNKTIFKRNLKRFWLLPAFYLFGLIWAMPVTMYFSLLADRNSQDDFLSIRESILYGYIIAGIVYAVIACGIVAICLFSYLQQSSSVSFYHSLPAKRLELYATNFISGFLMVFMPVAAVFVISALVAAGQGMNAIPELLVWLLNMLVIILFFFGFAVLCMITAGQSWFAGAVYLIFIGYVPGIILVINGIVSRLAIGYYMSLELPAGIFGVLSPATFFITRIFDYSFDWDMYSVGKVLGSMTMPLVEGSVFAVFFAIGSYFLYKNRKSESAGDIVAFGFAKPVYRWGFAASFALVLSCLMINTVPAGRKGAIIVLYVFIVIFGALGFVLAQMMIKKSVHVLKGIAVELGIFAAAILIGGVGIDIYAKHQNVYVPDAEDVWKININSPYISNQEIIDRDVINEFVSIHRDIVDQIDVLEDYYEVEYSSAQDYYDSDRINSIYLNISYIIGEGQDVKIVTRHYDIPETMKAYGHLENVCQDPDRIKKIMLGSVEPEKIRRAYLYSYDNYEQCLCCYGDDAKKLYRECLNEIETGSIRAGQIFVEHYIPQVYSFEISGEYDAAMNPVKPERTVVDSLIDFNSLNSNFWYRDQMGFVLAFTMDEDKNTGYYNMDYYCFNAMSDNNNLIDVMTSCRWTY